jgi:hypothetical protein
MNTAFLLMAQYEGRAIIRVETVCKDYFCMTPERFLRKVSTGEIPLPIVRLGLTQKAAKGVYLTDLAKYLDERHEAAVRELKALTS